MREGRILAEEVLEAFGRGDLLPYRGDWIALVRPPEASTERYCGCGLGAVWLARLGADPDPSLIEIDHERLYPDLGLSALYGDGFVTGWDGGGAAPDPTEVESLEGWLDGRDAIRAVQERFGAVLERRGKDLA